MGITYGDHLIDIGYHDITPEQERVIEEQLQQDLEIAAREECERRGIDPDELCADGGVEAWMVVAKEIRERASSGETEMTCECGFETEACATNPCMRKKVHLAGLTPDSHWPKGALVAPKAPYPFCRTPDKCAGKGYCPAEIACND